ncbi:MAG: ABC transporter ATP-binding protein [Chloroflexi bacterium]|nr:ABC transporter ATP-binding protein [Chloroflexota bacterium]
MSEATEEAAAVPALVVERLTKRFGATLAIDDLSLALEPGTIYGLTGPNGGGKSTFLRVLATLERPTSGQVRVHGRDPLADPRAVRQIVGYGGPPRGTPNLTVAEELAFVARLAGLGHTEREEAVAVMLELVDLHDRRHRPVGTLSRGDLRRLSLARALVHDPLLVLLDGPFDGLDAAARAELRAVLAELGQIGKTLMIAASGLAELAGLCHAVGVLDRGRLVLSGTVEELLAASGGRPLRLTTAGGLERALVILAGQTTARDPIEIDDRTLLFRFDGDADAQAALLADLVAGGVLVTQLSPALDDAEAELAQLVRSGQ